MLNCVLLAVLAGALPDAGPWTPPKNPDAQRILEEAKTDVDQGAHETALAKLLWFHHNALARTSRRPG